MNYRRKQMRREQNEANRRCFTVSDSRKLNATRERPMDFPTIVRLPADTSQKIIGKLRKKVKTTSYEEAKDILIAIRRSKQFRYAKRWLDLHPGPESRLAPEALMLGIIFASQEKSLYWRSIVCDYINGLDSAIWHELGMCDNKTRSPISYNTVVRQITRLEQMPLMLASHRDNCFNTYHTTEESR